MDLRAEAPPSLPPTPLRCGGGGGSWVAPTGSSWAIEMALAVCPCALPQPSEIAFTPRESVWWSAHSWRNHSDSPSGSATALLAVHPALPVVSAATETAKILHIDDDGARAVDRPPWISQIDRHPALKLGTVRREFVWSRVAVQAWKAEIQPVFGPTACLVWIVGSRYDAMCTQEVSAL